MGLYRSRRNRILAGVCGGIAEWLGWRPVSVRLLYIGVSIATVMVHGPLVYIVLWVAMPKAPATPR